MTPGMGVVLEGCWAQLGVVPTHAHEAFPPMHVTHPVPLGASMGASAQGVLWWLMHWGAVGLQPRQVVVVVGEGVSAGSFPLSHILPLGGPAPRGDPEALTPLPSPQDPAPPPWGGKPGTLIFPLGPPSCLFQEEKPPLLPARSSKACVCLWGLPDRQGQVCRAFPSRPGKPRHGKLMPVSAKDKEPEVSSCPHVPSAPPRSGPRDNKGVLPPPG